MPTTTNDLTVVRPFGDFAVGDRITKPSLVKAILADERAAHVVQVAPLPDEVQEAETPVAAEPQGR